MRESRTKVTDRRTLLKVTGGTLATGVAALAGCTGNGADGDGADGDDGDSDGGGTPTESDDSTSDSSEDQPVESQLGYSHYPAITNTAPVAVALDQGFFEDHGVSITEVNSFSGGGTTTRGITTGGIGIGGTALSALVQAYLQGATIRLVGLQHRTNAVAFQTLPDSDIESMQDIAGEKVAVTNPGSSSEASLVTAVNQTDGISVDDIEIVYGGGLGESLTLLSEGEVAVSTNFEPTATEWVEDDRARNVWLTQNVVPDFCNLVLAASDEMIREEPDVIEGIIAGFQDSFDYVQNNVEESARIWANEADLDESLAISSLERLGPENMFTLSPEEEPLKTTASSMQHLGQIDDEPPWDEIIDQQFLPDEHRVDWV